MKKEAYVHFSEQEIFLRDLLAADRTILANERTFLAYIRTAFGVSLGGITLIKLFSHIVAKIFGWILIPLGLILFFLGLWRYRKMLSAISKVPEKAVAVDEPDELKEVIEEDADIT